jgi:hypothetical protein
VVEAACGRFKPKGTHMTKAKTSTSRQARQAAGGGTEHQSAAIGSIKAPFKQQGLAALLLRDEGATLEQMIGATGWLPHTTRAAMTGLRKKGYVIDSDKVDGVRIYRAVAPE